MKVASQLRREFQSDASSAEVLALLDKMMQVTLDFLRELLIHPGRKPFGYAG